MGSRIRAPRALRPPHPDDDDRLEVDRALMEAERMMMQTLQTSLSLIGFGFTITEFSSRAQPPAGGPPRARLVGEALLMLGLLLLALGIWSRVRYRRRLLKQLGGLRGPARYAAVYRDTPSFVVAVLVLAIGLISLVSVLIRLI